MQAKTLSSREICDLELLINGGFSPLTGFLTSKDYKSVLKNNRLANGKLWTIPICLAISEEEKESFSNEKKIILQDITGVHLAFLKVEDIYPYSLEKECEAVFGCYDENHPYQQEMKKNFDKGKKYYLGGGLTSIQQIVHYDFSDFRHSPLALKKIFKEQNLKKIIAFQTRNPLHKSHFYLTLNALKEVGKETKLLLHPVVGITQKDDVDYFLRVNCYKEVLKYYKGQAILSLLPLSMRMAGPKEAIWHALIRKNFGATHFIVGRDHAGPSFPKRNGKPFYLPFAAQDILKKYSQEIGIEPIFSKNICYVKELDTYFPQDKIKKKHTIMQLSGIKQRELLEKGAPLPDWFSFPSIAKILQNYYKKKRKKGFCIYFVGVPASGKSTLANSLRVKIKENFPEKTISLLDGDIIRKNLSKGLGFSVEDRKTNIHRIGYVASEIVKHSGICLVANIAPFSDSRIKNREIISKIGYYIEVYVTASLETCIKRDPKGLYKKAQQGEIKNLTGYNEKFELPENADIVLDTDKMDITECTRKIFFYLQENSLL